MLDSIHDLVLTAQPAEQRAILQSLFARIWATHEHGVIAIQPQPVYLELVAAAFTPVCTVDWEGLQSPIPTVWLDYRTPYRPTAH